MKKTILVLVDEGSAGAATEPGYVHPCLAAFAAEAPVSGRTLVLAASDSSAKADAADAGKPKSASCKKTAAAADTAQPGEQTAPVYCWNPLSWAGASALWQELENQLAGPADELIVLVDPQLSAAGILDCSPRDIERNALAFGSGLVRLLQMALERFAERKRGTVLLLLSCSVYSTEEGAGSTNGLLRMMAQGTAAGLAEGLLAAALPEGCRLAVLRDESAMPDLLARHVVKLLDDWPKDTSKILRFTGRSGLFNRF
ncbi:MAG: hypothetical protein KKI09_10615 [Spirochaetes bacterium]|nr:hypothetical protein [Spirochaetota bacterium]MBU0955870.1 hypothetical protein [Spirochaetota bacterium]